MYKIKCTNFEHSIPLTTVLILHNLGYLGRLISTDRDIRGMKRSNVSLKKIAFLSMRSSVRMPPLLSPFAPIYTDVSYEKFSVRRAKLRFLCYAECQKFAGGTARSPRKVT